MPSIQVFLRGFLLAAPISAAIISTHSRQANDDAEKHADRVSFQRLLDQVDPGALHAALHTFVPKRFKHGTFKEDRHAAELVHDDDPAYATSMVVIAKRQTGSDNTTSPIDDPSSSDPSTPDPTDPVDIPTSEPPVVDPTTPIPPTTQIITEQPAPPSTVVVTSTSSPPPASLPSSVDQPLSPSIPPSSTPPVDTPTTPSIEPSPSTSESSVIPSISTTSDETTPSSTSASPTSSATSSSAPSTTSSTDDNTASETESSSSRRTTAATNGNRDGHTSRIIRTTTLPNGAVSTITAVTVVGDAAAATGDDGAGGSSTAPSGSLQSEGAAPRSRGFGWEAVGVIGGAVGFALAL